MKALIVVDIQNDFLPGGALAVDGGDQIISIVNQLMKKFDIVVATQDWHPVGHGSFASTYNGKKPGDQIALNGLDQILWPDHCVQGTSGTDFHPTLAVRAKNFPKGIRKNADSYSGFFDDDGTPTGLDNYLRDNGVSQVFVCGLATDYCVKCTALDAAKEGFACVVVLDACRGVAEESTESAIAEMRAAGIGFCQTGDLE